MQTFVKSKAGQGMTEYIIIIAIVAVAALAITMMFGKQIRTNFAKITGQFGGQQTDNISHVQVGNQPVDDRGMGDFDTGGQPTQQ